MTKITHSQARRELLAAADHLLDAPRQAALDEHLRTCAACRAEAEQLAHLEGELRTAFHEAWDPTPPPQAPLVADFPAPPGRRARFLAMAANLGLAVLWLWLYRAVFPYLRIIFTDAEFRTNQIVLVGVLIVILGQLRHQRLNPRFDALPHFYAPGLALALGSSLLYLAAERYLDINTLSATLFGLATYGLLGLWMAPRRWTEGLPAALLLVGALPFGQHLETFVGYPMRLATAQVVSEGLHALGITSIGQDTILMLESGFAQVDSPCSGVKSLWTGALFLLAVTWLERHPINGRWLGISGLLAGLLFVANVARVGALVLVGQVAGWRPLAEMIHVPLGVVGFVAVCAAAAALLRTRPMIPSAPSPAGPRFWPEFDGLRKPVWFVPLLALTVFAMGMLYSPRPQTAQAHAAIQWPFPPEMEIESSPLSAPLYAWATSGGADSAERWHFTWGERQGTVLFLTSRTWRGQHRPERCFEVEGLTVESSQTYLITPDFPVRFLSLKGGPYLASAAYWLQSGRRVTEDYATRMWADLAPQRQPWVLVTVLFEGTPPPDAADVHALFEALRETVARGMEEVQP